MQRLQRLPLHPPLLAIAFLSFVALGLQGGALGVAWLHMQETFGRTLESLGVLLLAMTLGSFVASFFSGRLIAAIGVGRYCLLGSLAGLVGLIATSVTPSWAGLVAAALAVGLGRGAVDTGINTFVAHNYSTSRMNWLHAVFGVGATLGPLLVTLLVITLSRPWQLSYVSLAAFQIVIVALFAVTLRHWRLDSNSRGPAVPAGRGPSVRESLRLVAVRLGIALFALHTGLQISAGQLSNNLFVEGRGIEPGVAGLWVGLFWGFITLGRLLFGGVIDRVGVVPILRLSTIGTVIGGLLLWWNPSDAVSYLGLAVMGLTLAPVFPTSVSRTLGLVGPEHAPNTIGFQMAGSALGVALLPGLTGFLGDRFGLEIIPICLIFMALAQILIHELITSTEQRTAVLLREH